MDAATKRYLLLLLAAIGLLTLYRYGILISHDLNLYSDEAYYYGWAQSFEFGYYSKPPMIAWLIMLTTSVCGDSELCIKAGSLLVYPLTSAAVFLIGKRLFDARTGLVAALAFATLPAVSMSSLIISTDVVLFLFWSLTLYFFICALETESLRHWLLAGVCGGLGLLSKYTMIIFLLSAFLYLAISRQHRHLLKDRKPYLAMLIAILVFLPNLVWNYQNGFASFKHTAEISQLQHDLFHLDKMFEFLAGQFLVFGPLLMGVLCVLLVRYRHSLQDERYRLLISFALPFLFIITLQSLLRRAHLNWAAPTYVAATVLVVAYLFSTQRKRLLAAALGINLLFGVTLYHYHAVANILGIELNARTDPYVRILGWRELGNRVAPLFARYPRARLVGDNRNTLAELIYYLRPHPFDAVIWNPAQRITNHYHLTADIRHHPDGKFILVSENITPEQLQGHFRSIKPLGDIRVPVYNDFQLEYRVFYLEDFLGY